MSWRSMLAVILLIAVIVTGWSAWHQRSEPAPLTTVQVRSDYVLTDFELIALDGNGEESFALRAPRLEQHPDDRSLHIETPLFLVPAATGDYWEIRSDNALITAGHDEIHLREDVRAEGSNRHGQPVTMETTQLNVFPESRTASTPARVTVEQPGSTIQGRGMDIDLSAKRYEFHSEVKTRYVPTRR